MKEYDPVAPEWFAHYRLVEVSLDLRRRMINEVLYPDWYLFLNGRCIGRMTNFLGRVICQSSIEAGVFAVYDTASKYYLGHLLVHGHTAHAFIRANEEYFVDSTFRYKMDAPASVEECHTMPCES